MSGSKRMVTVEVPVKLTIDDLLNAVETLPSQELTGFVRRVVAIQSRRGAPLLGDDEEQALLKTIEGRFLSDEAQKRLDDLREKSRKGALTPEEHAELLSLAYV